MERNNTLYIVFDLTLFFINKSFWINTNWFSYYTLKAQGKLLFESHENSMGWLANYVFQLSESGFWWKQVIGTTQQGVIEFMKGKRQNIFCFFSSETKRCCFQFGWTICIVQVISNKVRVKAVINNVTDDCKISVNIWCNLTQCNI